MTHKTMADWFAGLPRQMPEAALPLAVYAAVIEWPSYFADAESSLILARTEAERDEEIRQEILSTADALINTEWGQAIDAVTSEDWRDWLDALDETTIGQPFVSTYTREV